jgi:hypothetical protein
MEIQIFSCYKYLYLILKNKNLSVDIRKKIQQKLYTIIELYKNP